MPRLNRPAALMLTVCLVLSTATAPGPSSAAAKAAHKKVLVELYTSQG